MRVGFVLDDSLDRPDGVQQYVMGLGEQLKKLGHKVYFLTGETKRTDIPNVHSMAKVVRVSFNGNVVGTPLPADKKQLNELLNKLKLDVLHVQLPYSPVLAGRVINAAGKQTGIVGTLHIYPNSFVEHKLNGLLRVFNNRTLKRFDKILAVSSAAAHASGLEKKREIEVIPNHVDTQRFIKARKATRQSKSIVFLGRLVPRKGCQQLLAALALLKHKGRLPAGARVRIAGDGPLRSQLERYVKANNLKSAVTFGGFLPEQDKPAFLAGADIAVFPSSGGESFGIVLIEAMAAGAVVLAGDNQGYATVLDKSKQQLFHPSDTRELADKLETLLTSPSLKQQLRNQQDNMVKQYDSAAVTKQIEAVYNQVLLHKP